MEKKGRGKIFCETNAQIRKAQKGTNTTRKMNQQLFNSKTTRYLSCIRLLQSKKLGTILKMRSKFHF